MNRSDQRFDWNHARSFLAVVDSGSFTAAAEALKTTQPTIGRQLAALERDLGVALFERVGRGVELTPTGLELAEQVRLMGRAAEQLSMAATGSSQLLEGTVCITAIEVLAAFVLPAVIRTLRQREPGIHIDLLASNSFEDLRRREADIAVRGVRPSEPELIARKVGDAVAYLYASEDYLDVIGRPDSPQDLVDAQFLGFERSPALLPALKTRGFPLREANYPVFSDSHLLHWSLVKEGLGIGLMESGVGDADPGVGRVLPDHAGFPFEVWLVAHRELRSSRRIRRVFDHLADGLSERFRSP